MTAGKLKQINIAGIGSVDVNWNGSTASFDKQYYIKDHLGSVRLAKNLAGTVVSARNYSAFGETIQESVTSGKNKRYRFTGKERDDETNNDYFGARYYDSEVGRWNAVDPMYEKYFGWSSYNYCKNNPVINFDPNGCEAWKVTRNWDSQDIKAFAIFSCGNYDKYVALKKPIDCADLQYSNLIDYASKNGLPLTLKSAGGVKYDQEAYDNEQQYRNAVLGDLGTESIPVNTTAVDYSDAQAGDMRLEVEPNHHCMGLYAKENELAESPIGAICYGSQIDGKAIAPRKTNDWPLIASPKFKFNPNNRRKLRRWNVLMINDTDESNKKTESK